MIGDRHQKSLLKLKWHFQVFWLMRYWQNLILFAQEYPPRFLEVLMLFLAMIMLFLWGITGQWPYLVLSLSYSIGSSVSILLRESIYPSGTSRLYQITAIVLLLTSIYGFSDLPPLF